MKKLLALIFLVPLFAHAANSTDTDSSYQAAKGSFAFASDWANIQSQFNASGKNTTTTTVGTITSGSTSIPVASSDYLIGNGIAIAGAGVASAELVSYVTAINKTTNTLTINDATNTTITTGAVVNHDDTRAFQNALSDSTYYNVAVPAGLYNVTCSTINYTRRNKHLMGAGVDGAVGETLGSISSSIFVRSVIIDRCTTNTIFYMGSDYDSFVGIDFYHPTPATAGADIQVGPVDNSATTYEATAAYGIQYPYIANVWSWFPWVELGIYHRYSLKAKNINGVNYQRHGLYMDSLNGGGAWGGDTYDDLAMSADTDISADSGYDVISSDWNQWNNIKCYQGAVDCVHLHATDGYLSQQVFTNLEVDNLQAGYAFHLETTGYGCEGNIVVGGHANLAHAGTNGTYSIGSGCTNGAVSFMDGYPAGTNVNNGGASNTFTGTH